METKKVTVTITDRIQVEIDYTHQIELEVPVNAGREEIEELAKSEPGPVEELCSAIHALEGAHEIVDQIEIDGTGNEDIEIEGLDDEDNSCEECDCSLEFCECQDELEED